MSGSRQSTIDMLIKKAEKRRITSGLNVDKGFYMMVHREDRALGARTGLGG
jgi:hypothetical protein